MTIVILMLKRLKDFKWQKKTIKMTKKTSL